MVARLVWLRWLFYVCRFRHYPYTVPFYTPLQILCGTRRNRDSASLMSLYTAFGWAVVNQYRPFGHPVRPRTGFKYWFFKLLLWHYLPAYFYPDSLGTVPQSRMNLVPSSLMRSLKPCPSPSFITWRISQLKTSNRYAKTGFLFCSWQIGKCNNLSRLIVPPSYRIYSTADWVVARADNLNRTGDIRITNPLFYHWIISA